jgi:outer membrane protein assembly factor BamD
MTSLHTAPETRRTIGRGFLAVLIVTTLIALAGCGGKRRERREEDRSFLTSDALYERAMEELAQDDLRKAEEYLTRIQLLDPESIRRLEPLVRLALADVTFYMGDDLSLIEARSKYLDFVTLYSDHPRAPYAQLQAGMCSLQQVRHPTRDQSQTFEALGDLRGVIRRWPSSPYAGAAKDMIARAEGNLAQHDLAVGKFYFNKKAWGAAAHRLKRVIDRYPRYTEREELYFYLGEALVRDENMIEGRIYLERLVADYPDGSLAKNARKFLAEIDADGRTANKEKKNKKSKQEPEQAEDTEQVPGEGTGA